MVHTVEVRTQLPDGAHARVVVARDFIFFQVNGLTTLAARRELDSETVAALAQALAGPS